MRLQARRLHLQSAERLAYLTDLAPRPDRDHLADACPAHHQRPGEHVGQVIATRPAAFERGDVNTGNLAHRCGLTRQQRFIGLQVVALNEDRIGWHPVLPLPAR